MSDDVLEGEVVEVAESSNTLEIDVRHPTLTVTPQVGAAELVTRLAVIREAMETAMEKDVDYGVIPGTDKPTLYKPGAEKLNVLFQLDIQLENEKIWGPGDHLTVMSHATVYHAPTGARQGYGEGLCTTRERKYGKRKQERLCPTCGIPAVIKGKAEYGGGWLCWKKRDGCGAKYNDGDPAIESQEVGEIENPDLPDLWNMGVKMAEKRARVDAVLAVTGASALFTQDVEDTIVTTPAPTHRDPDAATDFQLDQVRALLKGKKVSEIAWYMDKAGIKGRVIGRTVKDKVDRLSAIEAERLILTVTSTLPSDRDHPTDVPADADDFEHPPEPPMEMLA